MTLAPIDADVIGPLDDLDDVDDLNATEAGGPVGVGPGGPAAPAALTCAAALLAASAFGWVAGSIFTGLLARGVGLLGAALGVGVALLSARSRQPAVIQYAGAVLALVVGALLVLPLADGTPLPTLVVEAVRDGGLGQPPVAFDPGWRFLLLVTTALLGEAIAALALSFGRPRTAALLALPFVVGGVLLQPAETEVTAALVALLLLVASLAVAFGADLAAAGAGSGGFELRRLARGAVALVVLGGALAGVAQLGFLFPPSAAASVIPPMRPPAPPPSVDRVLFTVTADRPTTWRLGTLDVYRTTAWLTPPYDASTLVPVDGPVPIGPSDTRGPVAAAGLTARITLLDLAGKSLPGLANPLSVTGGPEVLYDPRTQSLRTAGTRPARGTSYEVTAPAAPDGRTLSAVTAAPAQQVQEFLEVPTPPAEVTALLAAAPTAPFARLQFVRRAYFAKVGAAGAGNPVDVPPARVAEMLAGREATPYEITAGEVLLARWAGVPARLGYGWFGGDRVVGQPGAVEIRPRHGATWLEVHFAGSGWVPIVGTPPKAKASTSTADRNNNPSVRPTDELALVVYVPVEFSSARLAYVLVRYYVVRALPVLLVIGLVLALLPALARLARRTARRRAAARLGPRAKVAAAYAELRDSVTDLGLAGPAVSPLELVALVEPDDEHRELAWLVTRGLWGDLARDLQPADVETAETMSRSVGKRLRAAQPGLTRVAALTSRASLRDPWTTELPTVWPARRGGRRWLLRPLPVALVAVLLVLTGVGVVSTSRSEPVLGPPRPLPAQLVPTALGDVRFVRERAAESSFGAGSLTTEGQVFSVRQGDVVQGSIQVAALAPRVDVRDPRVRDQVLSGVGGGRFAPARIGEERVFRLASGEQTVLLSFARDGRGYTLMSARAAYADAERLFAAVLAFGRGEGAASLGTPDVPVPDPRRGSAS